MKYIEARCLNDINIKFDFVCPFVLDLTSDMIPLVQ